MNASSYLIVISGLPSSGKSTVAARLRGFLPVPLIAKDAIKERLFDELGTRDREWSRQLSRVAYTLMFAQAEEAARCRQGCILEGNFRWRQHQLDFERLQAAGARWIQVHCFAQRDVLVARFRERAASGKRHPGHVDIDSLGEIENELRSAEQIAMPLLGPVVDCDTTDDWRAAIERACGAVLALAARAT